MEELYEKFILLVEEFEHTNCNDISCRECKFNQHIFESDLGDYDICDMLKIARRK